MKHILTILAALTMAGPFVHGQDPKSMTVDELVTKNIEAKGGAEALRSLQSVKVSGKLLVNEGQIQLGFSETRKRPNEIRTEVSIQGMTAVNAFDGNEGWKISPFQGRKDPEKMSADDVKAMLEDSEFDGPLVNWQQKGSKVEY